MAAPSPEEVEAMVRSKLPFCIHPVTSMERLEGGTANYVFRVHYGGLVESKIAKYTPPYVASNFDFKLTDRRAVSCCFFYFYFYFYFSCDCL